MATILVVEDDEQVRNLVCKILRRAGHCVVEADSAKRALDLARINRGMLELVVTDCVMPEMSGDRMTEFLVADHPDLPILYMSGYTDADQLRSDIYQSDRFIPKTHLHQLLEAKVLQLLEQKADQSST